MSELNPTDRRIRWSIFALFFFSGACGLIYQIVWTRMMTIVFGITVYAVSTVLCSFMAGLALGSLFFGRMADRTRRPLLIYGLLEIGIGLFALAFPWIMDVIEPLFVSLYRNYYNGNYYLFSFLRFLIVFPVLLVPTFLMGGTFPIMSRYFVRSGSTLGRDVGFLYAINTTGAVLGTFSVGFIMLAYLGMSKSILVASLINLVVGAVSIALAAKAGVLEPIPDFDSDQIPSGRPAEDTPLPTHSDGFHLEPGQVALVLVAIGLSGFASLGLEVVWTRVLVFHTHNTTYAFSAMLMAFLIGIAAGSWVLGVIIKRVRNPLLWFAVMELCVAVWSLFSLALIRHLPPVTEFLAEHIKWNNWFEAVTIILAQVLLILFVPTFLMGMTFPLATRLATQSMREMGRKIGVVYSANTLGTVLGSFIVGFAFIPLFGVRGTFLILAGILALISVILFLGARKLEPEQRWLGILAAVSVVVLGQWGLPKDVISRGFANALGELKFYKEEVTDTVMVVDLFNGPRGQKRPDPNMRMLVFADGRGTAGHPTVAEDRFYAHLPMLIHPDPQDILNICIGAGNTIGAFTQHARMKTLTAVDLSPGVVEANAYFDTNYHALSNQPRDPRLTVRIEDGRNFLLGTDRKFDIIHLDPPEFHTAGVVFLYTEEFYRLVREHLKPGGIFSHWFNAAKLTNEEMQTVCATFHKVFPDGTNWQGPGLYSMNFVGSDRPLRINYKRAMQILESEPKVKGSLTDTIMNLQALNLGELPNLFAYMMMSDKGLAEYTKGAPIITDDMTRIDYSNPKSSYSGFGFIHLYSPADMTKFWKTDKDARAKPGVESRGGWQTLTDLTLQSNDVVELIDWEGCTPEERQKYTDQIHAYQQTHKNIMQKYCADLVANWQKENLGSQSE